MLGVSYSRVLKDARDGNLSYYRDGKRKYYELNSVIDYWYYLWGKNVYMCDPDTIDNAIEWWLDS